MERPGRRVRGEGWRRQKGEGKGNGVTANKRGETVLSVSNGDKKCQ